jgi:hypothetical protein
MKEFISGRVTPQRKAIGVNDKFGNTGIKKQQGSTIVKYDTLDYTGQTELRFFEGSAQRNFPLSNTGSDGNKLGVGNSMVVERAYLTLIETDKETGAVKYSPITISLTNLDWLVLSEFGMSIANSEVIKTLPILSWTPQFGKDQENEDNYNFEFDTQIVIPPLLEYVCTLRIPTATTLPADFTYKIRLTIEGTGAIIAPRTTF